MESNDLERLNRDARDAWNQNASFLEERTGEGNDWRLNLVLAADSTDAVATTGRARPPLSASNTDPPEHSFSRSGLGG